MQLVEQRVPQAACMYSSKADEQQAPEQKVQEQKPVAAEPSATAATAEPASTSAAAPATTSKSKAEEEWTEVVEEKSGQTYYWNEKTGEGQVAAGGSRCVAKLSGRKEGEAAAGCRAAGRGAGVPERSLAEAAGVSYKVTCMMNVWRVKQHQELTEARFVVQEMHRVPGKM